MLREVAAAVIVVTDVFVADVLNVDDNDDNDTLNLFHYCSISIKYIAYPFSFLFLINQDAVIIRPVRARQEIAAISANVMSVVP